MAIPIQLRRGTATEWNSANPVPAEGELCVELDTHQYKVGDGIRNWTALPYGGVTGPLGPQGIPGPPGISTIITASPLIYNPLTNTLSLDESNFPDGGNF